MTDEINNACQTLELEPGASLSQIGKARREMTTAWSPDRFPSGSELQRKAREQTKAIHTAYEVLKRHLASGEMAASARLGDAEEKPPPKTESAKEPAKPSQADSGRRKTSSQRRRKSSRHSRGRNHRKSRRRKKRTAKEWLQLALFVWCGFAGMIVGAFSGLFVGTKTAEQIESWEVDPSTEISHDIGEVHDLLDIAGMIVGGGLGLLIGGFGTKRVVRLIAKAKRRKRRAAQIAAVRRRRRRRNAAANSKAEPANEPNQSPGANNPQNQERKILNSRPASSRARIRPNRTKDK